MGRWVIFPSLPAVAAALIICGCGAVGAGSAGTAGPGGTGGSPGPTTGTVSGTVTDAVTAVSLPGVEVTATDKAIGGTVLAMAMTNISGWFSLTVPVGDCYVTFSMAGYTPSAGMFVGVGGGVAVILNAKISGEATGGWNVLDPADLERIKATKICPGCRLYGADLRSVDLTGANLIGANLIEADMAWADLTGAILMQANLSHANLAHANLTHANLTYWADLSGANLSWADLTGADLSPGSQYLSGANLTGADLTGADLSGAIMPDYRVCADHSIGECK